MQELNNLVEKVMRELYLKDKILFENNVSERCLVYNFAIHLRELLKNIKYDKLNLDIEYNRNCKNMKTISCQLTSYPDLILHKRGSNCENKLVIEFKKWNNQSKLEKDRVKLHCFKNEYDYRLCMLIVFDKSDFRNVKYEII